MKLLVVIVVAALCGCAMPYGKNSVLGIVGSGASHEQIDSNTADVKVFIDGFTPAPEMKPRLLQQARELGLKGGYATFVVSEPRLISREPGVYWATARVGFTKDDLQTDGRRVYRVADSDPYMPSLPPGMEKSLARMASSSTWSEANRMSLKLAPIYLDAVNATINSWNGDTVAFVRPGRQRVYAMVTLTALFHGFVEMDCEVEAGGSYALTGKFAQGELTVWVQDVASGQPVGRSIKVPVGKAFWL